MLAEPRPQTYIYAFKYDYHHEELCKLESRQLFNQTVKKKVVFTDKDIDPSISPFIKSRCEVLAKSTTYSELLTRVEELKISITGFKVDYLILSNDATERDERRAKLKDIGYRITGQPNFTTPTITYCIGQFNGVWYFGTLQYANTDWYEHNNKPSSFSNSICMKIAKTLVSMASEGNKNIQLLDACCGVGTILLEACVAGFKIEGNDINAKTCEHARRNLAHYNYSAKVLCNDIKDVNHSYDAAIIDLPYNLYSYSNEDITANIIASTAAISNRIVVVSISDISQTLKQHGLTVIDSCTVEKRGKSKFTRQIWVCTKSV